MNEKERNITLARIEFLLDESALFIQRANLLLKTLDQTNEDETESTDRYCPRCKSVNIYTKAEDLCVCNNCGCEWEAAE